MQDKNDFSYNGEAVSFGTVNVHKTFKNEFV